MFKIISVLSLFASVYAVPSPVVTYGGPALHSTRLVSPTLFSGLVGSSVLSLPSVATQHVTVARPTAVAVERLHVGSVPSVSVVNEPTTIVTPGKPIRGHSYTSEVRHDSIARLAAPLIAYGSPALSLEAHPAPVVEEPISQVVETNSLAAPLAYSSEGVLPSAWASLPQTIISAPQVYATGAASRVVAAPASVKGYTLETGRTDLVNEIRLRAASIPATIVHDSLVESLPAYVSQPLLTKTNLLSAPLISTLIKK